MIQAQVINKILQDKSVAIITDNNFGPEFFEGYTNEYNFIMQHYDKYRKVPDEVTFIDRFPNFPITLVSEPVEFLTEALIEDFRYRLSVTTVNSAADLLRAGQPAQFIDYLDSMLPKLTQRSTYTPYSFKQQANTRFQEYCKRKADPKEYFLSTGFKELDDVMGGWDMNDELCVILARPNVGKSWILLYTLLEAAKQGKKVGLYSGEMSEINVAFRLDTYLSHLKNFHISRGYSDVFDEYALYIQRLEENLPGDILMVTPDMVGGFANKTSLSAFVQREGIEVLGVDQFSLLSSAAAKGANSWEIAKNISMDLKILQTQCHIPVIVAAQQNRESIEGGVDTTHIAGSDRLGQDATTVLHLDKPKCETPILTIEITKARNCRVGTKLQYTWDIDTGTFTFVPQTNEGATPPSTYTQNTSTYAPTTQSFDPYGGQGYTDF